MNLLSYLTDTPKQTLLSYSILHVIILVIFFCPAEAKAEPYAGVGMGISSANEHCQNNIAEGCSDAPLSLKLYLGYRIAPFVAVEVGYNKYADESYLDSTAHTVQYELEGFTVSALGILPLGIVDIYGKIGAIRWESEVLYHLSSVYYDDGYSPLIGAGLSIDVTKSFALRGDVEAFYLSDTDDTVVGTVAIGFTVGF